MTFFTRAGGRAFAQRLLTPFLLVLGSVFGLMPSAAAAQEGKQISADEYLEYLNNLSTQSLTRVRSRASTLAIPSGFSTPKNVGFLAVAGSNQERRFVGNGTDGSLSFGFGLGDAEKSVGAEVAVGISSVGGDSNGQDFADSGSISLKLSRFVPSPFENGMASVAAGVGRAGRWGEVQDTDPSYYLAGSSTFLVPVNGGGYLQGIVTGGVATAIGTAEDTDGAFFGLGLGVNKWVSLGGSFYGNELIAGITTFHNLSDRLDVQMGLSYGDVGHQNSSGRVMLSLALINTKLFKSSN
jgi:hypothetical protein